MILYLSDFDLSGSGYMRIGTRLCNELIGHHEMGVLAIGLGYDRREHHWPFSIVPCPSLQGAPAIINQLKSYGAPIEALVVALDIPLQESVLKALGAGRDYPYIGIFPLEAGPLCMPWAMVLAQMDARLVMSRFGQEELARAGVESRFIPFGVDDPGMWRPPAPEERAQIRHGLRFEEDDFVILTVADNQERKNLAAAMEIVGGFAVEVEERDAAGFVTKKRAVRKVVWNVVTRMDSVVGWKLDDLAMRHGIYDLTRFYNRGVPSQSLWALYAAADAFLLTSKAEGLAIPALEAMACRVTVVGTDCAAIHEHLEDGRGRLVPFEHLVIDSTGEPCSYVDPFGNGRRCLVNAREGTKALEALAEEGPDAAALGAAQEYVRARTWEAAGAVLAETIYMVRNGKQEALQTADIPEAVGALA